MLKAMEYTPNAVFYRTELEKRFPQDLQKTIELNLLKQLPPDYVSYGLGPNPPYLVIRDDSGFQAINEEDPEEDPICLTEKDFIRYSLNITNFLKIVQQKNNLIGKPIQLHPRLYFIGEILCDEKSVAYVLVFVNDSPDLKTVVSEIPHLILNKYQNYIAVYPSQIPDVVERHRLENLKIRAILLPSDLCLPSPQSLLPDSLSSDFVVSETHVMWKGQRYPLTRSQSAVIRIIHKAHQSGMSYVSWEQIRNQLESYDLHPARISDVVKNSPLWKTLILNPKKGLYCLNI